MTINYAGSGLKARFETLDSVPMMEMRFSSGFFRALLSRSGKWSASVEARYFTLIRAGHQSISIPFEAITALRVDHARFWAEVTIVTTTGEVRVDGVGNNDANVIVETLATQAAAALWSLAEPHLELLARLAHSFRSLLERPFYLANRDFSTWLESHESSICETTHRLQSVIRNPFFPRHQIEGALDEWIETFTDARRQLSKIVEQRNEKFILDEIGAHQAFFDTVETCPLTDEQRRAVTVMEDHNRLVAAAGSGKTSTIVAKVGYALLRGYAAPNQVLVLAFNNGAAQELEQRINDRLRAVLRGQAVKVKTFHKLGLEIISEVEGKKPTVPGYAGDDAGERKKQIRELIQEISASDANFRRDWTEFNALFWQPAQDPATFASLEEWNRYVKETGISFPGRIGYRTFNGETVKSQGELAIADWLFMNGVNYEYERAYQYQTADKEHRQYYPDFYFPEIDCYLEHYALKPDGQPPPAFGKKYHDSMQWKRALHQSRGTDVFETYFSDFRNGTLFSKLRMQLTARGVTIRPRSDSEILELINRRQERQENNLFDLIQVFIKHAKANQVESEVIRIKAESHSQPARAKLFARLAVKILEHYDKKLASENAVDFEDMLVRAARYAHDGSYKHPYRLVLVDEFQDTSHARAGLLRGLLKSALGCKLFVVGDDWQSIYRFTGSDITLFADFASVFGTTATNYLTQTFRSNKGIADAAARFVQKNPEQISKSVVARDLKTSGVITIRKPDNEAEAPLHVLDCLGEISMLPRGANEVRTVFLLARYSAHRPAALGEWQDRFRDSLRLEFKTIHSSKGLQADYVVVLGLDSGSMGFPSSISDDPLIGLVMAKPEVFPHAEERRLFYVALTRARHGVYLLASKSEPSSFVEELEITAENTLLLRYPDRLAMR